MPKILSISDQVDPLVYSLNIKQRFSDVDFVISCGDLSYLYQEFVITVLEKPLYFVHGNHDPLLEDNEGEPRPQPFGAVNLHRRMIRKQGVLMGGVEGSIYYNGKTPYQYTQSQMWRHTLRFVPGLLFNKIVFGRYLDIFVSHAPPSGVHEGEDHTHQGIKAFRWLIDNFQPSLFIHGHIHVYHPDAVTATCVGKTMVLNTFRYRVTELDPQLGKIRDLPC